MIFERYRSLFHIGTRKLLASSHNQRAQRLASYRAAAIAGARRAIAELESRNVKVLVTGSLADNSFDLHSDVDFLITQCPRHMKYVLEGIVEDALGIIPFDVVYLDEIAPRKLSSFTEKARRVEDLG